MLLYKIRLPKETDAEAFVTFMREEYIPAVHKGPTRIGQVTDLVLLQGETADTRHEFFLHVGWSGLSGRGSLNVDNEEVLRKFESFGARLEFVGAYTEVAAWHG
jgi:hypothetical protein